MFDFAIIGGGFYGLYLANYLSRKNKSVILFEKEYDLMQRSSYNNQARVHNGYHYPRNILTALRSTASFSHFSKEFEQAIYSNFKQYYAIGKILGKVNSLQFLNFCKTLEVRCETAPQKVKNLFNQNLIEDVFYTQEYAFNTNKLKELMIKKIENTNIKIELNTSVTKISKNQKSFVLNFKSNTKEDKIEAKQIFNCTYTNLNTIKVENISPKLSLKHELTEMALIELPEELKKIGITVMCGPFFSFMPFPAKDTHSLSHVRYTPHYEWTENSNIQIPPDDVLHRHNRVSAFPKMIRDASRYIPSIINANYKESLWEIKTTLPSNESNDGRPILLKKNIIHSGYHCIMGGKIDNVYDIINEIEENSDEFNL